MGDHGDLRKMGREKCLRCGVCQGRSEDLPTIAQCIVMNKYAYYVSEYNEDKREKQE